MAPALTAAVGSRLPDNIAVGRTVTSVLSNTAYAAAAALSIASGIAAAWPVARLAGRRSAAQPADCYPELEAAVVDAVRANPTWYPIASTLTADDFTDPQARASWQEIERLCADAKADPETPAKELQAHLDALTKLVPENLAELVPAGPAVTKPITSVRKLIKAGSKIVDGTHGRENLSGAARLVAGDPTRGEPAFYRPVPPLTKARLAFTASALTVSLLAALTLAVAVGGTRTSVALSAASLALLAVFGVVWTLVDHDTLYIDTPTFWPVTGVVFGLGAAAALAADDPGRIVVAAVMVAAVAAVLEGSNLIYRMLRGTWGLGGGDTILIIATVGAPVLATGEWKLGYAVIMSSLLCAIGGFLVRTAAGRGGRRRAFAFGPFLVAGWVLASLFAAYGWLA